MSYDLVIKNGTVVDGTGAKRYQADVAIADGKVAEIGKVTEGARRTIDADGLVVGVDGALGAFGDLADLGDLAVGDGDVGPIARRTSAIDHGAVLDDEVIAHRRFLPGETFHESTPQEGSCRMRKTRASQSRPVWHDPSGEDEIRRVKGVRIDKQSLQLSR